MKHLTDKAFIALLEVNKDRIYRICRIYATHPIEPQDLFQEVIVQIWKSYSSFKGKSDISTWIYRIALNVCYRSKLNLDKMGYNTVSISSIQIESNQDISEYEEEKYEALRSCIKLLKKVDQNVLILYLEELSYKEIAQISGISENYVAVKMKRIRKLLFSCIAPKIK